MPRKPSPITSEDFWIEVSLSSADSVVRIFRALKCIQTVHTWTVEYLNNYFLDNSKMPDTDIFRKELSKFIRENKLWKYAQRYSMERAAEQTIPYFTNREMFDENVKYIWAEPKKINFIQIRIRSVWKRYLAQGGGITTVYGELYPEGEWRKILREQAGGIALDLFPFLWHSIYLRHREEDRGEIKRIFIQKSIEPETLTPAEIIEAEDRGAEVTKFEIKFNFHPPGSKAASAAEKRMEEEYG